MATMQSEKKHVTRWRDIKPQKKSGPKKLSHKELIAKWTRDGGKFGPPKKIWTKSDIDRHRNKQREGEERPDAGVMEEAEETGDMLFKASDLARARMAEMAEEMQIQALQGPDDSGDGGEADDSDACAGASPEELHTLIDCRRSQLEELEMLEAMFPDEFCPLYDSAGVDKLRAALEAEEAEALRSVAAHPPLELLLQVTVPDERSPDETGGKQFVASILLRIAFPPMYPTEGTPPEFRIEDVMITDALNEIGLDKVLWSEVNLDESKLITEMQQVAADILPDPCVAGIVSWISGNVFLHSL
mmetsp:Transcript_45168/g.84548  ORF Transcript_45168/g.84548 Transcript_45168/m.84548 type:complete len:302 (+) Transcript_45168:101-1006(+)